MIAIHPFKYQHWLVSSEAHRVNILNGIFLYSPYFSSLSWVKRIEELILSLLIRNKSSSTLHCSNKRIQQKDWEKLPKVLKASISTRYLTVSDYLPEYCYHQLKLYVLLKRRLPETSKRLACYSKFLHDYANHQEMQIGIFHTSLATPRQYF